MDRPLDIADVARRTGLTARALRFYEGRGLVRPLRTASGRRCYGAGELARLNQVVALKAAGFGLADIGRLLDGRGLDLAGLLAAQLDALDAEAARVADARRLLLSAKSRVDRGEPLDAATLCALIRTGDTTMHDTKWDDIARRYFSEAQRAEWAGRMSALPAGFDQQDYAARWHDLGGRIAAALPLDPASAQAQGFLDEWQALLAPFSQVATPDMKAGVAALYDDMPAWEGEASPGFDSRVWQFVKAAGAARRAAAG